MYRRPIEAAHPSDREGEAASCKLDCVHTDRSDPAARSASRKKGLAAAAARRQVCKLAQDASCALGGLPQAAAAGCGSRDVALGKAAFRNTSWDDVDCSWLLSSVKFIA